MDLDKYKTLNYTGAKKPKSMVIDTFQQEFDYIKNKDIKNFAIEMLRLAPGYFYSIPSSSSGKHHPKYEFCQGGLVLHTKTVVYLLKTILDLQMCDEFSEREKDLLIVAALLHDFKKNGNKSHMKYTVFDHPRIAEEFILQYKDCEIIPEDEIIFIADAVKSHMGQWNTNGKNSKYEPLELPKTNAQKLLHLCDYLSSMKDISYKLYLFKNREPPKRKDEYVFSFGKYTGKTPEEIFEVDPEYLNWAYSTNYKNKKEGGRIMFTDEVSKKIHDILFPPTT